jgi:hypothetical protein
LIFPVPFQEKLRQPGQVLCDLSTFFSCELAPVSRLVGRDDLVDELLLGFLLTHELDAVACREWRLLYVLRVLPEATARTAFIALHVPLIAALAWTTAAAHPAAANARLAVAAFALVHAALHYRLRRAPAYEFHAPLSSALIAGAALCGAAYLVVALRA